MTDSAITEIHYGLDRTSLLVGPDWGEIDEDASVAAYRAALQERLQQAFPAATVEINQPRIHSWAVRADGSDAGQATCASPWYETATDLDEQLFAEPDVWLMDGGVPGITHHCAHCGAEITGDHCPEHPEAEILSVVGGAS